jgi:transposase
MVATRPTFRLLATFDDRGWEHRHIEGMNLISCLLPDPAAIRLETWSFEAAQSAITIILHACQITAPCPLCGTQSKRVHSCYERTLADLPWGEHAVTIRLRVRRLFCKNARCGRRIFTERLPGIVMPWARKTTRLNAQLTAIGLALGGNAGVRLGRQLGLTASRNTLLRRIRQVPMPPEVTPAVLGVDDWALRKRATYGTVLVDLERRRPVALLPDREADTLAAWLRTHPGVAVIARDRAGAYAKGARSGAPEAVQVADRFHLLQNLAEMLEVVFTTHAQDLRAVEQAHREALYASGSLPLPPAETQRKVKLLAGARHERRKARHEQVWALFRQGWPAEKIGPHLGISRATVYRYLRSEAFPERRTRRDAGRSRLDPWRHIVLEYWNNGRRDGRMLFAELRRLGYRGSYATLTRYLRRFRALPGDTAPGSASVKLRPVLVAVSPCRELTPRTAAWTILCRAERRSAEDQTLLADLRRSDPELGEVIALAEEFIGLVRDGAPDRLDPWLHQAVRSTLRPLRNFAKHLSADYDAVRAAVTLSWSTGPVEGQINRLKMVKRSMYGRAGLDLLSRRFLLAA